MDCSIHLLSGEALEGALRLSSTAGWNQRLEDWRMLVGLAPAASFAAVDGGRIVGTAIGIDYQEFSWIAMMLVDPAYRGRGIGRRLLEAAMDAVPADRPIRLDATPMGRPLYASHGFRDEARLTRHAADADERVSHSRHGRSRTVRPLTADDFEETADCDVPVFRGARRCVLRWAFETAPQYARIMRGADSLPQYCFGRRGRLFDQIGPVVAADADAACALAAAALSAAAGRAVVIDAFDERSEFADWLGACGFHPQRPLFRMRRPPRTPAARIDDSRPSLAEFAIFGPEFA